MTELTTKGHSSICTWTICLSEGVYSPPSDVAKPKKSTVLSDENYDHFELCCFLSCKLIVHFLQGRVNYTPNIHSNDIQIGVTVDRTKPNLIMILTENHCRHFSLGNYASQWLSLSLINRSKISVISMQHQSGIHFVRHLSPFHNCGQIFGLSQTWHTKMFTLERQKTSNANLAVHLSFFQLSINSFKKHLWTLNCRRLQQRYHEPATSRKSRRWLSSRYWVGVPPRWTW